MINIVLYETLFLTVNFYIVIFLDRVLHFVHFWIIFNQIYLYVIDKVQIQLILNSAFNLFENISNKKKKVIILKFEFSF